MLKWSNFPSLLQIFLWTDSANLNKVIRLKFIHLLIGSKGIVTPEDRSSRILFSLIELFSKIKALVFLKVIALYFGVTVSQCYELLPGLKKVVTLQVNIYFFKEGNFDCNWSQNFHIKNNRSWLSLVHFMQSFAASHSDGESLVSGWLILHHETVCYACRIDGSKTSARFHLSIFIIAFLDVVIKERNFVTSNSFPKFNYSFL